MGARRGRRTHDRRRRHSGGAASSAQAGAGPRTRCSIGISTRPRRSSTRHRRQRRAGQGPTVAIIHLAMVQGAVYDAVNSIDGGHAPYLDDIPAAPASASKPAAVATAAHHVPVGTAMAPPLSAGIVTRLNGLYADLLAALPDGVAKTAGIAAGEAAAAKMLSERAADGRYGPFRFTCGEDAGEWRPTTSLVCTTPSGPTTRTPGSRGSSLLSSRARRSSGLRGRTK